MLEGDSKWYGKRSPAEAMLDLGFPDDTVSLTIGNVPSS